MARNVGIASSSNSSFKSTPKCIYHVFLSFRGEDTRRNFTDHLYTALCQKGLTTFRDDEELERGEVISDNLLKAIEQSLFSIVVLSKNYASSSWCLVELQKILKSRNELGQEVFPIFCGVNPSDVRHQKGSFGEGFAKLEKRFKEDQDKVQNWRDSLIEVAELSGWDSENRHEAELIQEVVQLLWRKLHSKLPPYNGMLVGIDSRLEKIDSHLGIGLDDVRFVGIWGLGGIGKTTLASIVYERLQDQFEICCFLSNVREISEGYKSQIYLQAQLLSHLNKGLLIENTHHGKKIISSLFCNKKVLIVLDDVSSIDQLDNLAESKEWFGAGSRVIITTRNVQLLESHGVEVDHIYEAELLNEEDSLRLFSNKAFRTDQPKEGYWDLTKSVIKYSGGLPLALRVLGSSLFGKSIDEWEDALDKLKQVLDEDILEILKISYEMLDGEQKRIFLDIACFFKHWTKNEVMKILMNCGLHARVGIKVLIERSLLTDGEHLYMHDLIQEMGKSIVFRESTSNAGKRSRLWSLEDINKVLKRNMGTEVIEGMVFLAKEEEDMVSSKSCDACWDSKAFSRMCNLRLFIISSDVKLPCGLECLSSALKVLHWEKYPHSTLPPGAQLVDLQMRYSKLKQLWNKSQCLENLKYMDLSHSKYLIKIPRFSELPNLETLELEGCVDLVELHPSLGNHKRIQVLNLKGCKNLKGLPRKLEIPSLKEFVLHGCNKVRNLPVFGETMKNLVTLDVGDTDIVKLPESLGLLTSLETLNLKGCKSFVCLPHNIHNLKYLKVLDISGCSRFSRLPENLNENEALETLDASGTAIIEVPSSIGHLEKLMTLSFHGCKRPLSNSWILPLPLNHMFQRRSFPKGLVLPSSIFNLKSLTKLDLSYCNIDDGSIPGDLSGLSSLKELDLSGNMFANLPSNCFSNLLELQYLWLNSCPRLWSLPQPLPGLLKIEVVECASLDTLAEEQLLHFFHVVEQGVEKNPWPRVICKFVSAIIPGREIPPWFENQIDHCLDEKGEASLIDITPCEWQLIAICTLLDDEILYPKACQYLRRFPSLSVPSWRVHFIGASDGKHELSTEWLCSSWIEMKSPHLWILFLQIRENDILGHKPFREYTQIRLSFLAGKMHYDNLKLDRKVSVKCGWRVLRKGDLEKMGISMTQNHLPILQHHKHRDGKHIHTLYE